MVARRRLDAELVRRGLSPSRTQARHLIDEGRVLVAGTAATKPATMVDAATALTVVEPAEQRYASRGGYKLAGALDRMAVPVDGRQALDAGAAHGGFTDVLLRRGAARVVAVDVAYGQLDWRIRSDARVVVLERTNVRLLTPDDIPPPAPDLVVADLSFIALAVVLPALRGVAALDADFLLMVKPQFEVGRHAVGRGGVVRDPQAWRDAIASVVAAGRSLGLGVEAVTVSPLPGPSGNIEYFVWLRADAAGDETRLVAAAVEEGTQLRAGAG